MATGLTHGVRRGYWSILGLEIGLMLQLALVAAGLGAVVTNSILAFTVIKWIGVAYLAYLAVRQWRTATVDLREQVGKATDGGRLSLVVRGFLVNATNPKGLVFFLAVLPQFVVPTSTPDAAIHGDRSDDGRRRPHRDGLVHRALGPAAAVDAHTA